MFFRDLVSQRPVTTVQRLEDKTIFGGESVVVPLASTVLLGGGALILTANPVVAGGIALLPIWMCLKNVHSGMQRKIFQKRSGGCFAHLLGEADLVALIREIGKDAVAAQLCTAIEHGQPLSKAAENLAKHIIEKRPATTIAEMLAELDTKPLSEDELIDVPAETIVDGFEESPAIAVTAEVVNSAGEPPQAAPASAIVPMVMNEILKSPFDCYAVIGSQRTCKSYVIACTSRKLAEQGTNVFVVSFLGKDTEDPHYWAHAKRAVYCNLKGKGREHYIESVAIASEIYDEFINTPNSVLVIDEYAFAGSKYNTFPKILAPLMGLFAGGLAALSSGGKKDQQAIWTIMPQMVAGALQDVAKGIKTSKICYLTIAPTMTVDWEGQAIGFDEQLFEAAKRNFPSLVMPPEATISRCRQYGEKRIGFINGKWMPVGTMPTIPKSTGSSVATPVTAAEDWDEDEEPAAVIPPIENPELLSLLIWLKRSGRTTLTAESLRNSHWAKKADARSTARTQNILACAVEAGLLVEKTAGEFAVAVKLGEIGDLGEEVR
jgi:hypothetical protein